MQIGTRQHDTAHYGIAADHEFDQYVFVLELKSHISKKSTERKQYSKKVYGWANRAG
jgi:hypothetical protein